MHCCSSGHPNRILTITNLLSAMFENISVFLQIQVVRLLLFVGGALPRTVCIRFVLHMFWYLAVFTLVEVEWYIEWQSEYGNDVLMFRNLFVRKWKVKEESDKFWWISVVRSLRAEGIDEFDPPPFRYDIIRNMQIFDKLYWVSDFEWTLNLKDAFKWDAVECWY